MFGIYQLCARDSCHLVKSLLCDETRRAVGRVLGTHAHSGGRRVDLPHVGALSPAVDRLPAGAVDRSLLLRRVLLRPRLRFLERRSPGYRSSFLKAREARIDTSRDRSSRLPVIKGGAR